MGRRANAAFLVAGLAMGTPWVSAQEKPKSEDVAMEARQTETTPLKISVTFTEFEGDKKVGSEDWEPRSGLRGQRIRDAVCGRWHQYRLPSVPHKGQQVRHQAESRAIVGGGQCSSCR